MAFAYYYTIEEEDVRDSLFYTLTEVIKSVGKAFGAKYKNVQPPKKRKERIRELLIKQGHVIPSVSELIK